MNKKTLTKISLVLASLVVVAISGGLIIAQRLTQPVLPGAQTLQQFAIPKNQSVIKIGQRLQEAGLIKSGLAFRLAATWTNQAQKIQAGSFELSPSLTLFEVIEKLTQGTNDVWVTIPEGLRREEIAASLEQYDLNAFDKEVFLAQTVGLEGRLYPDTYLLPKLIDTQAVVNLLTRTFEQKMIEPYQDQIEASDYTLQELLTLASIVQREAHNPEQMRQVAAILYRRLNIGMPLQVDATLQYAKGYNQQTGKWWDAPLRVDKEIESAYNTYLNPGLPPQPICNPGAQAFQAVLEPGQNNYLFYLHDRDGSIHYGRTLEEHNQNISRYLHR